MGMKRKDALKRLKGFAIQVEYHLEKMAANPENREIHHWKREVRGLLLQMEWLLPQIGRKTGTEWENTIAAWKVEMEQFNDD